MFHSLFISLLANTDSVSIPLQHSLYICIAFYSTESILQLGMDGDVVDWNGAMKMTKILSPNRLIYE